MNILKKIERIDCTEYENSYPFPHTVLDNILEEEFAIKIQEEILNLDEKYWDRYENPFEKKYTLRDKNNFPENTKLLYDYLSSELFIEKLSNVVGEKLHNDNTKNWWGIHKYKNGDKLDIHSDAGIHPITGDKKHVTLGIYLSKNWGEENGGHLEIWEGGDIQESNVTLTKKMKSILPIFNRLILFNNTNNAWHGNPDPVSCDSNSTRIFLTISYLSRNHTDKYNNKYKKAYFIKRPSDPKDIEKDRLRLLRADSKSCKEVYKHK